MKFEIRRVEIGAVLRVQPDDPDARDVGVGDRHRHENVRAGVDTQRFLDQRGQAKLESLPARWTEVSVTRRRGEPEGGGDGANCGTLDGEPPPFPSGLSTTPSPTPAIPAGQMHLKLASTSRVRNLIPRGTYCGRLPNSRGHGVRSILLTFV
jgi:hypothetical protein